MRKSQLNSDTAPITMTGNKCYHFSSEVTIPSNLKALLKGKGPTQSIMVKQTDVKYINNEKDNN
tara:strand:- start:156 stop:347 length:192 start_codon:yes stop_codon:yes gene_type:complete